jgi:hypothetical protein
VTKSTIYTLALLVAIVVIAGGFYWVVTSRQPVSGGKHHATSISPDELRHFQVFLQHRPCVDHCPVYAVLAKGSGTVQYVGGENVETTGTRKTPLSVAQLTELYRAVQQAKFFSIKDIYHNGPGGTGCKSLANGEPRVVIGVTKKSRTKVIHYDYGCHGAPAALKRLARRIDKILKTRRWTGERST